MRPAGTFKYKPNFELDKNSATELMDLPEVKEVTGKTEICRTIIDYEFDDVDAKIVYGEIGDANETAKFFLRTVFGDHGGLEEAKVYVPEDQENYPTANEFFKGLNEEESGAAEKVDKVESIANNFKTGEITIIDLGKLTPTDGESKEED